MNAAGGYKELLASLKKLRVQEGLRFDIKDDSLRDVYFKKIQALELPAAIRSIETVIQRYDDVIQRFRREYISIATIGKERQGKSQFLQSVSQLDNRVIPAYSGTSCTGATSVIWNDQSIPEGQLRAVITFRKRAECIDLVKSYVSTVDPEYPVYEMQFDDIGSLPMSRLEKATGSDADRQTAYAHLQNIVRHFAEFCDLFDAPQITLTDPEEIKRYVAQNNGLSVDNPDCEQYFSYLAVSRADIYCKFYLDAGKVRLIDTVGIESTQAGVEQAMLDTVKNECDAAVVVTRPIAVPQKKDLEINRILTEAFSDKKPEKWLFYLVNHWIGQNDNTVVGFEQAVSKWRIAGSKIVDCSDTRAVNSEFMVPVLDKLLENIDEIDETYLNALSSSEKAVRDILDRMIRYADGISDDSSVSMQGTQALSKGKLCFNKIGAQLRKVVAHYSKERSEPNYILWNATQKILNNLDVEINPGAEAIQKIADSNNVVGNDVWTITLHYVRNEITKRFSEIDDALSKEIIRFKNSLVRVLYSNLKELFVELEDVDDNTVDLTAKLHEMIGKTIADNPKYAQITEAISFLDNFQFNTRATIIQRVRSQLSIINPLCIEYANPEYNFYPINCGTEIEYYLTSRLSLIEENLRHALMDIYTTPNEAFYAVAEEFYDRLTFAVADLSTGTVIDMSDVWGMFFQEYSHVLWREQANDIRMISDLTASIKGLVPLLRTCIR